MNRLLFISWKEKMPIEIMYMAADNKITKRRIIVTNMDDNYIKAYCFIRKQKRIFKLQNILAVAKPNRSKKINYA